MKVKELREWLEDCEDDMLVFVRDCNGEYPITDIRERSFEDGMYDLPDGYCMSTDYITINFKNIKEDEK